MVELLHNLLCTFYYIFKIILNSKDWMYSHCTKIIYIYTHTHTHTHTHIYIYEKVSFLSTTSWKPFSSHSWHKLCYQLPLYMLKNAVFCTFLLSTTNWHLPSTSTRIKAWAATAAGFQRPLKGVQGGKKKALWALWIPCRTGLQIVRYY